MIVVGSAALLVMARTLLEAVLDASGAELVLVGPSLERIAGTLAATIEVEQGTVVL